jgi:hypothetical protein
MKESEARKLWCPFVRLPFHNSMVDYEIPLATESAAAVNRIADEKQKPVIPHAARCIGRACMAWERGRCKLMEKAQ